MARMSEKDLEERLKELGGALEGEEEGELRYTVQFQFDGQLVEAAGSTRRNALMSAVAFIKQWKP